MEASAFPHSVASAVASLYTQQAMLILLAAAAARSLPHGKWFSLLLLLSLLALNLPLQWLSCCRGQRGGCSDWTEYNNNNAFVNCPADVCLSSRHPCCHRARRPARVPACSSTSVCRTHALIKVNCTSHKMAATAAAAAVAKENCCLVNITTKLRSLHSLPPLQRKSSQKAHFAFHLKKLLQV